MSQHPTLRRALWCAVIFLAVIGVAVAVRRTIILMPALLHGYHRPAPVSNPVAAQFAALDGLFVRYPYLTMIHIIPGMFFMILGPLQFNAGFRGRHVRVHRIVGRVFLICAAVVGLTALVMSLAMPAIGGLNQSAATTLFSLLFLFALARAYWSIRLRRIAAHRQWMIRAFAIGLAVATIRPIVGIFFATARLSGLGPHEFFGIAFWIGFTLHLVAAEAWIHLTGPAPDAIPSDRVSVASRA